VAWLVVLCSLTTRKQPAAGIALQTVPLRGLERRLSRAADKTRPRFVSRSTPSGRHFMHHLPTVGDRTREYCRPECGTPASVTNSAACRTGEAATTSGDRRAVGSATGRNKMRFSSSAKRLCPATDDDRRTNGALEKRQQPCALGRKRSDLLTSRQKKF
jgi:hypothetical protein